MKRLHEAPDLGGGQGGLLGSDIFNLRPAGQGGDRCMTQSGRETATTSVPEIFLVTAQFLLARHLPTGESREL